ncbi:DUF4190 domain-containing protein [Actinomycetospora termitidis]|uniref:DUF4190 domain-containing protein n=1 Tax=Actinomycetospora termitidis TaxID=3053470 RepID=A0ABT7MJR3_9PSEU|nr:DUF4190 domain-containing protein [Actinomycetospora sp. Odt1-22]MDL5159598.1 DUF4190 domain-containing protein [Actinomycetospora sp. Odt1-22]
MSQQVPPYPYSQQPGGYGPPTAPPGQPPVGYGYGAPVPPGPHGQPPVVPPPQPTGTNVMAILAIVFAFLFSPLGIVFGIIGRRQTRRTGQSGRGLATTGLVLSIVFLVFGIAAVVWTTILAAQFVRGVESIPSTSPDAPGVSAPVVSGPAGAGTVTIADGDYGPELPADALATEVGNQTGATDVICPGYLPAQVDASSTCDGTVDGQNARLRATVTAVAGSEASILISRES